MNQQELDKLSNDEIKKLWRQTVSEARKQRGVQLANVQAQNDLGIDEEYYIDGFGNRIEGKKPAPKTSGHYVGPDGYVVELRPGEQPPEETGNGIVDWLNNQDIANDPELREALGADNLFFEERLRIGDADVLLHGRPESDGRHVSSRSTRGATHDLRFRLARNLPREQAIAQAVGYAESKSGPHFRELTDKERRICERLCVRDRNAAFVFYIQARLPEYLANEFLELGSAGDELGIQKFGADERISEIAEEAVANCFFGASPELPKASLTLFAQMTAEELGRSLSSTHCGTSTRLAARFAISPRTNRRRTKSSQRQKICPTKN